MSAWSWSNLVAEQEPLSIKAALKPSTCPEITGGGQVGKSLPPFIENTPDDYDFQERAAIMEFDGGLSRSEAEVQAIRELSNQRESIWR